MFEASEGIFVYHFMDNGVVTIIYADTSLHFMSYTYAWRWNTDRSCLEWKRVEDFDTAWFIMDVKAAESAYRAYLGRKLLDA